MLAQHQQQALMSVSHHQGEIVLVYMHLPPQRRQKCICLFNNVKVLAQFTINNGFKMGTKISIGSDVFLCLPVGSQMLLIMNKYV